MLPSDRDFALVEKYSKTKIAVYSSSEWEDILKNPKRNIHLSLPKLKKKDLFNFYHLWNK